MRRPYRLSPPGLFLILLASTRFAGAEPFQLVQVPLPWPDSLDVAIADMNGDGLADVVALNSHGPFFFECNPPPGPIECGDRMLLTVALNEGLGHFAPVTTTLAMCAPSTLATGDFNADGHVDVMVGNRGARDAFGVCSPASVSFYPGDGAGGFGTPQHLVLNDEPGDMATGDFDGDGVVESVVVLGGFAGARILRVDSGGNFVLGPDWQGRLDTLIAVAAGDLDGNGRAEIVVAGGLGVTVLQLTNTTPPVLAQVAGCPLGTFYGPARALVVGDFQGDAALEIVAGQPTNSPAAVTLLRGGPTNAYCEPTEALVSQIAAGYGGHLAVADINADGSADLATTDGFGHVMTLLGNGTGTFASQNPLTTDGAADSVAAGDLDGNGIDDLAVSGPWLAAPTGMALALINYGPSVMWVNLAGNAASWNAVTAAVTYDVVRGDLAILRATGGDFTQALEACSADNQPATALPLGGSPPVGSGWWFIGRPNYPGGPGTYDDGWGMAQAAPRDASINAAPATCP